MGNLKADEFLYYADILASLRREEILILGALHKYEAALPSDKRATADPALNPMARTRDEIVPAVLTTIDDFYATLGALTRTGLVIANAVLDGITYQTSPLMARLVKLAPFDGLDR